MTLFSGIAGFAARGSQVFEKVEEDMSKLMEMRLKDTMTRGQARWQSHKAEKKLKRTLAKALRSYGLSVDQVGVALEQGRGEEVLTHLKQFDSASPALKAAYGYDIKNLINMGCFLVSTSFVLKTVIPFTSFIGLDILNCTAVTTFLLFRFYYTTNKIIYVRNFNYIISLHIMSILIVRSFPT